MANFHELLPHSSNLEPSDFFMELKRMLAGKKYCSDEMAIANADAFFEVTEEMYYKIVIEKWENLYNFVSLSKLTVLNKKKIFINKN